MYSVLNKSRLHYRRKENEGYRGKKSSRRLAELTGEAVVYTRMPRCAYEVGHYTIGRDGSITVDEGVDSEVLHVLVQEGLAVEELLPVRSDSEVPDQAVHSEDAEEQREETPEKPVREKSLPTGSEETDEQWGEGESLPMVIDSRDQPVRSEEAHSQDERRGEQPDAQDQPDMCEAEVSVPLANHTIASLKNLFTIDKRKTELENLVSDYAATGHLNRRALFVYAEDDEEPSEEAALERISAELARIEERRDELLIQKGDLGIQEAQLHTLLKLVDGIMMRSERPAMLMTGTSDVAIAAEKLAACYDLADFYERTDEITQWGLVNDYDNDLVQRFIEKIIVKEKGIEVKFKAGITVTI